MTQCSDSEIAPTGVGTDEDEGLYKKALKDYQKLLEEDNDEEEEAITDEQASCVEKLLHNAYYGYFMSVMIIANVVCFMLQADYMARHWSQEVPAIFDFAELISLVVFVSEISMRIGVHRLRFFYGPSVGKNWFDFSLVSMQVVEAVLTNVCHAKESDTMQMLKMLRVARILRITRILHLLPEFQMLVLSIVSSIKSLTWVFLLVIIITSVFGVILTQIVTDHKTALGREGMESQEVLDEYFGSVGVAMLRLYMTISDGMHWAELADPMIEYCSPWTSIIFIIYSSFVTFCMMNVVTSFFVETALRVAKQDANKNLAADLWHVFAKADGNQDSEISHREFIEHLDEPFMLEYLKKLELSPDHVRESHFFELLDSDNSGSLSAFQLMSGCIRLMGPARTLDLEGMAFDLKLERQASTRHRQQVQNSFKALNAQLRRLSGNRFAI